MLFGAHVSASGGLYNGPLNATALGLECFQFFSRPPQGGKVGPISKEVELEFLRACDAGKFEKYYIHAPYIINLASSEDRIRNNTIEILRQELDRGSQLRATALMFHPGSAKDVGADKGVKMVVDGMKKILKGYKGTTRFLIEVSAGAGAVIGSTFEEVHAIIEGVSDERVGVCFDTAHAFASGYDLRNAKAVNATMKKFDDIIGLDLLEMSHCNDSKVDIAEKRDRHEHLGKGFIGIEGFKAIVASKGFKNVNLILETPPDHVADDLVILKKLRGSQ